MLSSGSSLQYCCKLPDFFEHLLLYSITFYIGITASKSLVLMLFISLIQSESRAQFLNTTCFLFLSAAIAAATSIAVTVFFISIDTSL